MKRIRYIIALYLLVLVLPELIAEGSVVNEKAPELVISEWIDDDSPGTLEGMRGNVIVINFFQMKCFGCKTFSIPLMLFWEKRYREREDIIFLSIHTVFEHHQDQAPSLLKEYVRKKGITHPVGVDMFGPGETIPITMSTFKTGGTPCITIIDKRGTIRFKQLGNFDVDSANNLIDKLLR
ncbi:MAG: hypothetical protein D8M57_08365 [Candidatus Scalindua sp. AMX11]|nr:MAG: hypothetical protein DWQ00_05220 [Candidatus Scalindua sp.]NOG84355.1 hypothetical protein [Planctomycetota bacterium]RZV74436.1 MAG: redoxin domain-containing protein [Candidatus Scalindua sp. SCAELEC01]TDE65357.1 MAG: hypothetical protein D8M57_08365 [Candidatus Scalindua sp. AMX11]GJQ60819.1 MAG: hypothetical protein SCALA701_36200 [Candidatus Scalindua sp.]